MNLSDRHRRFLLVEQFVHAFAINVVFNGAIAWLILRGHDAIPLWGEGSMGPDLLATGVLLPLIMCLIVSRVIARQVAKGDLPPLPPEQIARRGLHHRPVFVRGLVLALFGTLFASAPLVVLLELADAQPVSLAAFVTFKALWAGGLAAMISPPMAWWALSAASIGAPANALDGADTQRA